MSECKCYCGCGKIVASVPGKQTRLFYSDACSKRWRRATNPEHRDANPGQTTPDKSTADRGATATPDTRSSSTGDPQASQSGRMSAAAMTAEIIEIEKDLQQPSPLADVETDAGPPPTSQCYRDSGIPLPGDLEYRGMCALHHESKRWLLHPNRLRLTRAEERMRYAQG